MNPALYSTGNGEWETPDEVFQFLDNIFHFTLDAAATAKNTKCNWYIDEVMDALDCNWRELSDGGAVFLNPPYGRNVGKWVKKAWEESLRGGIEVVCLLPARTDTTWFHDYCLKYGTVAFIKGRIKFKGSSNSAPFPSMVVVFNGGTKNAANDLRNSI